MSESDRSNIKQNVENPKYAATAGNGGDANIVNNNGKTYIKADNVHIGTSNPPPTTSNTTKTTPNSRSNKTIIVSIAIAVFVSIFGTVAIFKLPWQKSNSSLEDNSSLQDNSSLEDNSSKQNKSSLVILQNVANGIDLFSPDLLPILPEFLEETDELLDREQLDRAIRNYNLLITVTDKFQKYLDTDPEEFEDLEEAEKIVTEISTKAKQFRQSEINAHRLSELKAQLKNKEFGKIAGLVVSKLENQYTEGAIRTTYKIIMRPDGFHADINNDGFISEAEVERIPCETLQEIERLWRKYTMDRCGWYEPESKVNNPLCKELTLTEIIQIGGENKKNQDRLTLLRTIFKQNDFYFIEPKLDRCLDL